MALAAVSGGLSAIGTIFGVVGQFKQAAAAAKAEKAREAEMKLEAARQRREQIRKAQVARATAISTASAQGAQFSSALAGGTAQIQNEAGRNLVAINSDQALSERIFSANREYAQAGLLTALGNGISSLGGVIGNQAGTLTRLGYV